MCIQSFPSGTYRDKTLVLQPSSLGAHGRNSCTAITQHLEQLFPLNCKGTVRPEERGIIALVLSLGDTLSITWQQRPLSNSLPLLHKGQQESQGPHLFPNSRRRHQTKMLRQWLLTLPKLKRGMVQAPKSSVRWRPPLGTFLLPKGQKLYTCLWDGVWEAVGTADSSQTVAACPGELFYNPVCIAGLFHA